jgi:hypothetical protein
VARARREAHGDRDHHLPREVHGWQGQGRAAVMGALPEPRGGPGAWRSGRPTPTVAYTCGYRASRASAVRREAPSVMARASLTTSVPSKRGLSQFTTVQSAGTFGGSHPGWD